MSLLSPSWPPDSIGNRNTNTDKEMNNRTPGFSDRKEKQIKITTTKEVRLFGSEVFSKSLTSYKYKGLVFVKDETSDSNSMHSKENYSSESLHAEVYHTSGWKSEV